LDNLNMGIKACGVILLWAAGAIALPAQTFTTLYKFCSQPNCTDGEFPNALVQATDGNFYGTAAHGGAHNTSTCYNQGCGTIFRITPSGTLTTLYNFCSQSGCEDGETPDAALIQSTNGNLYGTTYYGGIAGGNCLPDGCGTVFTITLSGKFTTLHSFDGTDGAGPAGALIQGTDGNFYGTTNYGGTNSLGNVFQITPNGVLTTLYSFCTQPGPGCPDGSLPFDGLVEGTDGDFYGTTYGGGPLGGGTVFKITSTPPYTLTTLYSFCTPGGPCPDDGWAIVAGVVLGSNGNFYGITFYGGEDRDCHDLEGGCGTAFSIGPGHTKTLHHFCSLPNCTDGANPQAGLVQGTDGNFYGTTAFGGAKRRPCFGDLRCGTVFTVTSIGTLTTLHSFDGADGANPDEGLIQGTDGNFYGETAAGGVNRCSGLYPGCGTVFRLSVALEPFVKTQPTSGIVGAAVTILGTSLTGATSVTFNGTAATFTVVSRSLITTTVPLGATTGKVKVTFPHGVRSSNVPFRVK
jgi:uncharacterized repeat protein (TIGR03803 family)